MCVYPGSGRFVEYVREHGLRCAVVSASSNCRDVLVAAGIAELFEVRVDREVAEREGLAGKPVPDMFLATARALHVPPARAALFEDALAGVQAGRAGAFRCIVGVRSDRSWRRVAPRRRRPRCARPGGVA